MSDWKGCCKNSSDNTVQVPQRFSGGTMLYDYDETFVMVEFEYPNTMPYKIDYSMSGFLFFLRYHLNLSEGI